MTEIKLQIKRPNKKLIQYQVLIFETDLNLYS